MEKILSKDGTPIAYQRSGAGAPLVLVHGTLSSHDGWARILPVLEQQFTVYAVDRRGYGESGDSVHYALEREAEDIAALVDSIGDDVRLLGHSFGGLCALEAALLTSHLRCLVIYEPSPLPVPGVRLYPEGMVEQLQSLLDREDRSGVVVTVFRDLVDMPAHEIELLKASARFSAYMAAADTVPRETRAEETYRFEPERFTCLHVPALLLFGGDSPEFFRRTIDAWHATLPNSQIVALSGQQHIAHVTAPELFVRVIQEFLLEHSL